MAGRPVAENIDAEAADVVEGVHSIRFGQVGVSELTFGVGLLRRLGLLCVEIVGAVAGVALGHRPHTCWI